MNKTRFISLLILLSIGAIILLGFSLWYEYWDVVVIITIIMFVLTTILSAIGGFRIPGNRSGTSRRSQWSLPFETQQINPNDSEFSASDLGSDFDYESDDSSCEPSESIDSSCGGSSDSAGSSDSGGSSSCGE